MEDRTMSIYARAMQARAALATCDTCSGTGWVYDGQGGPARYVGDPCPSICGACKGRGQVWKRGER